MKKKIIILYSVLLLCLLSCKNNHDVEIRYDNSEKIIYLTYFNRTDNDVKFPKIFVEMISNEKNDLFNINFIIESDNREKAWYHGKVCGISIPSYDEFPDRFILIPPHDSKEFKVCSLSKKYSFSENFNYVYINYDGYMGKSNRIKIKRDEFLNLK